MIEVSIVIVNYKTALFLEECVYSIFKFSTGFSFEIIIVDNSCDRNEFIRLEHLREKYPNIFLIDAKNNLGFGKANNLGAQFAKGKNLLFLNGDTILLNNAIFYLNDTIKNEHIGICCGNLYDGNQKPTHSYSLKEKDLSFFKLESSFFGVLLHVCKKNHNFNKSRRIIEIKGYVCGADLMIKRKLFEKIGGFDEDIFMYAEDSLLCFNVIKYGYKIVNNPKAKIIHFEGKADKQVYSDFKIKNYVNGCYIAFKKKYGEKQAIDFLEVSYKIQKRKSFLYKILLKKEMEINCIRMAKGFSDKLKELEITKPIG